MPSVTVKNVPENLLRRLKVRAGANRRSLNAEILACLEAVAPARRVDAEALLFRAAALRSRVLGRLTDSDLSSGGR